MLNYDDYKLDNPDDYRKRLLGIPLHSRGKPEEKEPWRTLALEHQKAKYFKHKK